MAVSQDLTSPVDEIKGLLEWISSKIKVDGEFGSMSCSVYDAAWVSMVAKPVMGSKYWLFPECFHFVLDQQSEDGSWGGGNGCEIDGILNTAASLLALKKHMDSPLQMTFLTESDLKPKLHKGIKALETMLRGWNVEATIHVGFEVLVPSILELLAQEDILFKFDGEGTLDNIRRQKLRGFDPRKVEQIRSSTALHSLEALLRTIDFDSFSPYLKYGAMMASPSSTAAFLMHTTKWSEEAEMYLRGVITSSSGGGRGGVPSAYPSTYFELSWFLSTMAQAGLGPYLQDSPHTGQLLDVLQRALVEDGLAGFTKSVLPDADDTSRLILTLNLHGRQTSPERLVQEFRAEGYFKTYKMERNPSLSANCNVFLALLSSPEPWSYLSDIETTLRYLCKACWESNGCLEDKWSISSTYPLMLLAKCLVRFLKFWEKSQDHNPTESLKDLVDERIPLVMFQVISRIVHSQLDDGSWGTQGSNNAICRREQTAYAILLIADALCLPCHSMVEDVCRDAIRKARGYMQCQNGDHETLWVEKVSYRSELVSESYIVAALHVDVPTYGEKISHAFLESVPLDRVSRFTKFYAKLPLFESLDAWKIHFALVESYLFLPLLKKVRLDIFPRESMQEDKYFEYIPFTWIASNNICQTSMTTNLLYEMMVISLLNYQADEYMETVVGRGCAGDLTGVRRLIERLFNDPAFPSDNTEKESEPTLNGNLSNGSNKRKRPREENDAGTEINHNSKIPASSDKNHQVLRDVGFVLKKFIDHVIQHPAISKASGYDIRRLKDELKTFLLAHVSQAEDNLRFAAQTTKNGTTKHHPTTKSSVFRTPKGSFYDWVHTTSADHTSCPYAFAFFTCCLGSMHGGDGFDTAEEKYFAQDLCRRLATMCRLYNDFGSVARDEEEKNLNSIHFPEFDGIGIEEGSPRSSSDLALKKDRIMKLAAYERSNVDAALAQLEDVAASAGNNRRKRKNWSLLKIFCSVTDTYGQIYVVKDIASRM